ncbi:MAG: LysR family transcriptional regulator [Rhodospirillaceae bacterium]|nr:LysR family transcriptional regulator [Rhodospirillaceae bacterium]
MKRINPDLNSLRAFVVLADSGGFRPAAEFLGLSGPALSRQIARLEDGLSTRLFDRDTRNLRLTPSGEELLALARRLLQEAGKAVEEFEAFLAARRGRVSVAGLPSITAGLLPPIIARFVAGRPNLDVCVLDALSDKVAAAVLEGRADFGLTAGASDGAGRLAFRKLLDDPFYAVAAPGGPLDDMDEVSWEDLVALPFIAMAQGTSVRALTEAALVQIGAAFEPRFEVSHLATAGALVAEGLGVSALPGLTLPVIGGASLVVRPLKAPEVTRRIGLVFLAGRTLSPAAQELIDLILRSPRDPLGHAAA